MQTRKASIKETGEELSPAEWERFDAAVAELKAERRGGLQSPPQQQRTDERLPCDDRGGPAVGDQAVA